MLQVISALAFLLATWYSGERGREWARQSFLPVALHCPATKGIHRIPLMGSLGFQRWLWWSLSGLNRRPLPCHGSALPTELRPHVFCRTRRPVLALVAGLEPCIPGDEIACADPELSLLLAPFHPSFPAPSRGPQARSAVSASKRLSGVKPALRFYCLCDCYAWKLLAVSRTHFKPVAAGRPNGGSFHERFTKLAAPRGNLCECSDDLALTGLEPATADQAANPRGATPQDQDVRTL